MLKPFTTEGRFECGMNEFVNGKVWAFVAIVGDPYTLGIAIANEPGYVPVPSTWCHADSYDEMDKHTDELNAAEGLDRKQATIIVASTMRGKVPARGT